MITMGVLLFMYIGLSVVGFSVLTPYQLGHVYEEQPVAGIVSHLPWGSSVLLPFVGVLAALTLFVAANAGLIGASRLSFNMGEYYQLPQFFHQIHAKFKTPYMALVFFAVAASIIVALSRARISFLADLYNFGAQIAFFATQVSLIVLRIKKPEMVRPFKVPLNLTIRGKKIPIPAVVGALASFAVWVLVVITKPEGRYLGFGWLLFGVGMYWLYRRKKRISLTGQIVLHKIKIPRLQALKINQILLPLRDLSQTETMQVACEVAKLHGAKITAFHVIEVPFSLPLDSHLPHRLAGAGLILKTIEALALDQGIEIELEIVRARSVTEAILELAGKGRYDLLLLEGNGRNGKVPLSAHLTEIMQKAPCRTWVCNRFVQ
jgi:APA family basic amino acid/polyamine antiporter